jgi:hypothetical protein
MLPFDPDRVQRNVRYASNEDLLDRVTVYRAGMEPAALGIIEAELYDRGIRADEIEEHAARREQDIIRGSDGLAIPCSFCDRPAVAQDWGWHRWWGLVPLFPRFYSYCREHCPPHASTV